MVSESLVEVLISISQKRRQGALKVVSPTVNCDIYFNDGRIVGIEEKSGWLAKKIGKRLVNSRLLRDKVYQLVAEVQLSTQQLSDALVGKNYVPQENFVRVRNICEIDLLHSLRMLGECSLEFQVLMIRPEMASLLLNPGQLLLDMVELDADIGRFEQIFGATDTAAVMLRRKGSSPGRLVGFESEVWAQISEGISVQQLFQKSLLSEYELIEGLLSLYEQGLLVVVDNRDDKVEEEVASGGFSKAQQVEQKKPSIMSAFDDLTPLPVEEKTSDIYDRMAYEVVDSLLEDFGGKFQTEDETIKPTSETVKAESAEQVSGVSKSEEINTPSGIPKVEPQGAENNQNLSISVGNSNSGVASIAKPSESKHAEVNEQKVVSQSQLDKELSEQIKDEVVEAEVDEQMENVPEVEITPESSEEFISPQGLFDRLVNLNFRLLEESRQQSIVISLILIFLLGLGLLLPAKIELWFSALGIFTSNG